jgi:hypothetical protein
LCEHPQSISSVLAILKRHSPKLIALMNQSKHVLLFGVSTVISCVVGAVVLAFAPGDKSDRFVQPINTLLGTALPAAIAATAGAFQGMQQNQRADTIVTGGVGSDTPELPRERMERAEYSEHA